ncbi:MAG: hypothetical protein ACJA2C_000996 [Marinoscillum sp.]|jgi:hypothetical protein
MGIIDNFISFSPVKNPRFIFSNFLLKICLVAAVLFSSGCHASYYKVPITKSRNHIRPYDDKKDRGRKRVKTKKFKSLKTTKGINDH